MLLSHPKRPSLRRVPLAALIGAGPFALAWLVAILEPFVPDVIEGMMVVGGWGTGKRDISVISLNKLGLSAIRMVNGCGLAFREEVVRKGFRLVTRFTVKKKKKIRILHVKRKIRFINCVFTFVGTLYAHVLLY